MRSQTISEPSGTAPYLQSPNVLLLRGITPCAAAQLTHAAAMMYREHMASGIWPQGFASEGSRDAFDISGGPRICQSSTGVWPAHIKVSSLTRFSYNALLNIWSPVEVNGRGGAKDVQCF